MLIILQFDKVKKSHDAHIFLCEIPKYMCGLLASCCWYLSKHPLMDLVIKLFLKQIQKSCEQIVTYVNFKKLPWTLAIPT